MNVAKTARNLAVADIALAFARDRVAAMLPGVEPRKQRRSRAKTLLLGGGVAATVAALLLKRDAVKGLLPGGETESAPAPEPAGGYTPPAVSNYDAAGPVANTATSVPVPPAFEEPAIDEAAEEAAAAAEAANIGGSVSDYAGTEYGELADEAERPLVEAGEGEAEGQEQAEDELRLAAESTEGVSPEQHQIEDAMDAAANPPETVEPIKPADDSEWNTWSDRPQNP